MSISDKLKKPVAVGTSFLVGLGIMYNALTRPVYAAEGNKARVEVTDSDISHQYDTIDDILKGSNITKVTPRNYKKLVEAPTDKLGKLVLVYASESDVDSFSGRETIIFKELKKIYSDKIEFLSYDTHSIKAQRENRFIFENTPVNLIPSVIMYNKEGKLIDILRGGPTDNKWIKPWVEWLEPWIKTNLTNPNGEYVIRMNNSSEDKKIYIPE
jgi:hypothetical protein